MIDNCINKKEIKQIYNYVKNINLLYNEECIKYLNRVIKDEEGLFCSSSILKDIINITLMCHVNMHYTDYLFIAKKLYKLNVSLIANEDELKNFFNIYKLVLDLDCHEFINSHINIDSFINKINFIYNSFENKNIVKIIFNKIEHLSTERVNHITLFLHLQNYLSKSRMYYSDELIYLSSINNFLDSIKFDISDNDKIENLIDKQLSFDKRLAGIYDVDDEKLEQIKKRIEAVELTSIIIDNKLEFQKDSFLANVKAIDNKISECTDAAKKELAWYKKNILKELLKELKNSINDYKQNSDNSIIKINIKQNLVVEEKQKEKNDEEELATLINKLKYYNNNIGTISSLTTDDYPWLLEASKIFDIEFLALNVIISYSSKRIFSLFNAKGMLSTLKQILDININFLKEFPAIFQGDDERFNHRIELEIINKIGLELFANLNYHQFNDLYDSILYEYFDMYVDALKINPKLEVKVTFFELFNYESKEEFGLTTLANSDELLQKTIEHFNFLKMIGINEPLKILKRMLDKNPNFRLTNEDIDKIRNISSEHRKELFVSEDSNTFFANLEKFYLEDKDYQYKSHKKKNSSKTKILQLFTKKNK